MQLRQRFTSYDRHSRLQFQCRSADELINLYGSPGCVQAMLLCNERANEEPVDLAGSFEGSEGTSLFRFLRAASISDLIDSGRLSDRA